MLKKSAYPSRTELLNWISDQTKIPIKRMQDLSSGVHFCKLLSIISKGKFNMKKINFKAKPNSEVDCLHNLRILNWGLEANSLNKKIDIDCIARQQIGPILEILQWWYDLFRKEHLIVETTPEEKQAQLAALKQSVRKLGIKEPRFEEKMTHEEIVQQLSSFKKSERKQSLISPQLEQKQENAQLKYESQEARKQQYQFLAFTQPEQDTKLYPSLEKQNEQGAENQLYPSLEVTQNIESKLELPEKVSEKLQDNLISETKQIKDSSTPKFSEIKETDSHQKNQKKQENPELSEVQRLIKERFGPKTPTSWRNAIPQPSNKLTNEKEKSMTGQSRTEKNSPISSSNTSLLSPHFNSKKMPMI